MGVFKSLCAIMCVMPALASTPAHANVAVLLNNRVIIDNKPFYNGGSEDIFGSGNYALNQAMFIDIPYAIFGFGGAFSVTNATLRWDFDRLFAGSFSTSPPASITLYVGADADGVITQGDRFTGTAIDTFVYSGGEARTYDVTAAVNAALADGDFFAARLEANIVPTSGFYGGQFRTPSLSFVPGVPEPDTWALMVVGFGMLGAAMRRRSVLAIARST